ncbi:cadherin-23-like [Mizuhopecten yessoensis]|uniref:Protocadherin gamma-B5 n=1 Tax=Mizuhopecten yessoensis TaxID=6573 RepID=A0A210PN25_MIZYE|nr:cadherin-23-like [Mizuhopecten yessoensis]OWF37892.1 Protocadherin gamma-B5 [Mizuhopecten yessoensis]
MAVSSWIVIVICFPPILVNIVNGNCVESLQGIYPALVRISEIENDTVLLNTTTSPTLIWNFTLSEVDNAVNIDKALEQDLFENFINISKSDTHVEVKLLKPLNTDYFCKIYNKQLNSFIIGITCKDPGNSAPIPLSFTVSNLEVDEFKPEFRIQPLTITIPESSPIGTTLLLINNTLKDEDCPPNFGLNTIRLTNYTIDPQVNGIGVVEIRLGSVGDVVLKQKVDFDKEYAVRRPVYFMVNVRVTDPQNRLTTTTLRINIKDVNDLPPAFDEFTYKSHTSIKYRGKLTVTPSAIHAVDQDPTINCSVIYSLVQSGPLIQSFDIDSTTGELSQIQDVVSVAEVIQIQATENCPDTTTQLSRTVPLLITLNDDTVPVGK